MAEENGNVGRVEQVMGVVVDVAFPGDLPEIYHALKVEVPEGDGREAMDLVLEVQQHLGDDRVKTVAMDSTDGLRRGDAVLDTGGPDSGGAVRPHDGGVLSRVGRPGRAAIP
jgi:F-type H+-transporting ATPase subunit beta